MLRVLLPLAFALVVPIDAFAEQPRLLDVLSIYRDLNDMCRDPSADDHHKLAACDVREKVSRLLNRMGYCYGKDGQDAAAVHWHKCVAHEIF
ncbi:hypothetical protein [Methylovirgula sp. HY1]|uniref:hypothetical protein n=1 Tax=Methylovirgula sp. HY1 TaxID=2822761 RepID=UPI001C5B5940|nr:hypothetical protein [Methylovirgula sp. HY1]QXX76451.1 hypothetical protein MHY1_03294 [Methylovirgula sp. HY1]